MLQLHGDHPQVRTAHVLESVRGQGRPPERCTRLWLLREGVAIEENRALGVPTNEVAPTQEVVDARPAVAMKRHDLTGPDERVENANGMVFKEQGVVCCGGRQGIKLLGPVICVEHGPDYSVAIVRLALPWGSRGRSLLALVVEGPNCEWIV